MGGNCSMEVINAVQWCNLNLLYSLSHTYNRHIVLLSHTLHTAVNFEYIPWSREPTAIITKLRIHTCLSLPTQQLIVPLWGWRWISTPSKSNWRLRLLWVYLIGFYRPIVSMCFSRLLSCLHNAVLWSVTIAVLVSTGYHWIGWCTATDHTCVGSGYSCLRWLGWPVVNLIKCCS